MKRISCFNDILASRSAADERTMRRMYPTLGRRGKMAKLCLDRRPKCQELWRYCIGLITSRYEKRKRKRESPRYAFLCYDLYVIFDNVKVSIYDKEYFV